MLVRCGISVICRVWGGWCGCGHLVWIWSVGCGVGVGWEVGVGYLCVRFELWRRCDVLGG